MSSKHEQKNPLHSLPTCFAFVSGVVAISILLTVFAFFLGGWLWGTLGAIFCTVPTATLLGWLCFYTLGYVTRVYLKGLEGWYL